MTWKNHTHWCVNTQRQTNQFNAIKTNPACVPQEMRARKEILDILSTDSHPYDKYLLIKDNKHLASKDLWKILSSLSHRQDSYHEVKEHMKKLWTDKLYKEYLMIKDNPNLTAEELADIKANMPGSTPEFAEIQAHQKKLENK